MIVRSKTTQHMAALCWQRIKQPMANNEEMSGQKWDDCVEEGLKDPERGLRKNFTDTYLSSTFPHSSAASSRQLLSQHYKPVCMSHTCHHQYHRRPRCPKCKLRLSKGVCLPEHPGLQSPLA